MTVLKKSLFFACFCSAWVISGCGGEEETPEIQEEEITNEASVAYNISHVLPLSEEAWKTLPKEDYPASVILGAKERNSPARISPIIVLSKEYNTTESIQDFADRNLEEVRRKSQDFLLQSLEESSDNKAEKIFAVYHETRSKDNTKMEVYSLYYLPKNYEVSYLLTIVLDNEETEKRKKYLKELLLSFSIEEVPV